MFFIMGITDGQKELNYDSGGINICKSCGAYSRYTVFMIIKHLYFKRNNYGNYYNNHSKRIRYLIILFSLNEQSTHRRCECFLLS